MRKDAKGLTERQRSLRVALIWNGAIHAEELLDQPRKVSLGFGRSHTFPLPAGVVEDDSVVLFEPAEQSAGFMLRSGGHLGGSVWINGQRRPVAELGSGTFQLGPDDYGVVTLGSLSVFFQHVRGVAPPRRVFDLPVETLACVLLAFFFVGGMLFICHLDALLNPNYPDDLELDADLIAQFWVVPPAVEIPAELREQRRSELDDPGLRRRDELRGAKQKRRRREPARAEVRAREVVALRERAAEEGPQDLGLLGALKATAAIEEALSAPSISDILGRSGSGVIRQTRDRGRSSGRLRGSQRGSGDAAKLFASKELKTVSRADRRDREAPARARRVPSPRRDRAEVQVSVRSGRPSVSGFLSADQIRRVVRANQAAIRYCYEVEVQRQPNLRGQVTVGFRINATGNVSTARIASSSLGSSGVEGCIVRQIRRWRFPRPDGGEVNVTYPFQFGVQGG